MSATAIFDRTARSLGSGVQLWRDAERFAEFANRRRRQDVRFGFARFLFATSKNDPHNTNY
jgi:hypothetical protein